jgi:uncharacterized repeat protein (TIGR03803 family)
MPGKSLSTKLRAALVIVAIALVVTTTWAAMHERVVHTFRPNATDGVDPRAGLIADKAGNLYGTAYWGGNYLVGTVFELMPKAGGGWTEKLLYSFNNNGTDGSNPRGGLIFDAAGNLYGTTVGGGTDGAGTVFELTPMLGGGWTEKVLYSFQYYSYPYTDGASPLADLIFDAAGNLYGTTDGGGTYSSGTVFELTPTKGGGWTEQVLYSFNPSIGDGYYPFAGLIFDAAGNLYGTTSAGGGNGGQGTVFELTPAQGGGWTEKALYSFTGYPDGGNPRSGLIFDAAGNLYGTTFRGGTDGAGTVFELTLSKGGGWTEQVLYTFTGMDGRQPYAGLIFDAAGNLYGTTSGGGTIGYGTVFELAPKAGGGWTEQVLYNFGSGSDGAFPQAALIFDAAGNLYGTTEEGGTNGYNGYGTVFELTPAQGGGWTEQALHSFNYNATDGAYPYYGNLISDAAGNLYGTTNAGGTYGVGMVFELARTGLPGPPRRRVLYSFKYNGTDGNSPLAGLIFDAAGNLYGTTSAGGAYGGGTVFELTPTPGGDWTEQVLYSFNSNNGADAYYPSASLIFDAAGNLYGTTQSGGSYYSGAVFQLTPTKGGGWTEQVLYSFTGSEDGGCPFAGLIFDSAGNLYGTTAFAAGFSGTAGNVFELTPTQGGGWTEHVLHLFGNAGDGMFPYAGLIFDTAGNLYGTTIAGGSYGGGTVFELTPMQGGGWNEQLLHSFGNGADGANPYAGLTFDAAGNLYGATGLGGTYDSGTVFELTPTQGGGWKEQLLHSFGSSGDGIYPQGGLIFDKVGNLYGTTTYGGVNSFSGFGTVFELCTHSPRDCARPAGQEPDTVEH